jgi:hypothetical protein
VLPGGLCACALALPGGALSRSYEPRPFLDLQFSAFAFALLIFRARTFGSLVFFAVMCLCIYQLSKDSQNGADRPGQQRDRQSKTPRTELSGRTARAASTRLLG